MTHKKVEFRGKIYWLHGIDDLTGFNLSPLDHYDEDGTLLVNPFKSVSYAIVLEGKILRYGKIIGEASELTPIFSPL